MDELKPCPECGGRTIEFRFTGLDLQYRICSRWKEPGHLDWDAVRLRFREMRNANAPASGRYT